MDQAFSTVGGGIFNDAEDFFSFIGGGSNNVVSWGGRFSVIAGGTLNNTAGSYSSIGGGGNNTAGGQFSTVPGGTNNAATGDFSFAAGNRAKANNTGSFVWADSQNSDFASTAANQFNVRASGGVRFVTGGAGVTIDGVAVQASGGMAWQSVTGTSQQAQSNQGYIANNATQPVTITLPALPRIGDIVRVTGASAGGWQISQNSGQSILIAAFVGKSEMTWTQTSASNFLAWDGVAASSDGDKLVAVVFNAGIYTSTNSGLTWTQTTAPALAWWRVASSSDGTHLYATSRGPGGIWASTDSGASWSQTTAPSTFPPFWNSVACSGDGSRVVAGQDCACYPPTASGQIWISSDYGQTWSQATPPNSNPGFFASISPNGQCLFAASFLGSSGIYLSTTFGNSWTQTAAPASYWSAIVSSTDASIVYAAGFGVYVSTNSGGSWTLTSAPQNSNYSGLACSADGSELIGGQFSFGIWESTDSGNTWTSNNLPSASWGPVAISPNGRDIVATQNPGGIYTASWLTTTTGASGFLSGGQGAAVELQYVGNGTFVPISFTGNISTF